MFRFWIILISCLISFQVANAQIYNVGLGAYGIQSPYWKCEDMIQALKPLNEIHVAFLYRTFGLNNTCLLRLISDPRFRSLEIHLTNGAGVRNQYHRWYEVLSNETVASLNSKIEKRDRTLLQIFKQELAKVNKTLISKMRQDQACFISPILEHNLNPRATRILMDFLRPLLPAGCLLVNNPMGSGGGDTMGADIYERHSASQYSCAWCINDLDGMDIEFYNRKAFISNKIHESKLPAFIVSHRDLVANYLWTAEMNGWDRTGSNGGSQKDPRSRTNFPNKILFDMILQYALFAENRFEIPVYTPIYDKALAECKKITKIPLSGATTEFVWKRIIKDNKDQTEIIFNTKYIEQFQSVVVRYKKKTIATFTFSEIKAVRQRWIVDQPIYKFPYHIVVRVNDTEMCYKIKNPKIKIGRR
jgi:hypothetical protein